MNWYTILNLCCHVHSISMYLLLRFQDTNGMSSEDISITDEGVQSDHFGSEASIPDLPPEATSTGPDAETFDSVATETPDVPIAVPESMEINVPRSDKGDRDGEETGGTARTSKPATKKGTLQTKTAKMKKTDKGIGKS